jgi:hypothetical protein
MPPTKRAEAEQVMPDLDQWLTAQRSAGWSWNEIAFALRAHGITVTGETVRQWCADDGPAAA